VKEVIGVGGISLKSPYVMQTLSDIMGVPIKVAAAQQSGALGVAMCAAVAARIFPSVEAAQARLEQGDLALYTPDKSKKDIYDARYVRYVSLSRHIGFDA